MPKSEEIFTKVPNIILDDTLLDVYERSILIHIARKTIGFGKKSDGISLSQFTLATGISKPKVIRTIAELTKKRLIKVVKRTIPGKGKTFNRYTLSLVSHRHQLVSDRDYPSISQTPPLVSDRDIQKKIEQKKIDKRGEREGISSISDKEINGFLSHLEETEPIRSPQAYRIKIIKELKNSESVTTKAFQEWKSILDREKEYTHFSNKFIGKYGTIKTNDGTVDCRFTHIGFEEDFFDVSIQYGDEYKTFRYRTFNAMQQAIKVA